MDDGVLDLYEKATREFDRRLRGVGRDQWSDPTPCTEWDVRTLVNHVVVEVMWVPSLVEGRTIAEVGARFDGDLLGADPARTWEDACAEAEAALRTHGALERTVHLSFGDTSAEEYAWQLTADLTIHAWDLARAAGVDENLDDGLVAAVLARLEPQRELLAGSGVFGAPLDPAPEADVQTRLLALVGRAA